MKSSKLILMGLTILLSVFTFNQLYNDFFRALYAGMVNFDLVQEEYPINENFFIIGDTLTFNELLDAADQYDIAIEGMSNQLSDRGMILTYYLYGQAFDEIIIRYGIDKNNLSFSDRSDQQFYSSISKDEKTGSFYFPQSFTDDIRMKSLLMMQNDHLTVDNHYIAHAKNALDIENFKTKLFDLSEGNVNYRGSLEGGGALSEFDKEMKAFIKLMFFIVTLLFFMILTIMIFKKMRSVSIRKMHGFSSTKIVIQEFGNLFISLILIFCGVTAFQFFMQISTFNHIVLEFIKILFSTTLMFIGSFITLFILLNLYIHYMDMGKNIKNFDFTKTIMQINLGLKMIILILLIPSFIPMVTKLLSESIIRYDLYTNAEQYKTLYSFEMGPNEQNQISNENMIELRVALDKQGLIYQNFDDYEFSNNRQDATFFPKARVNERYLSDVKIMDMKGNQVQFESEITVLVPTRIYQTTFSNQNYKCGLTCSYQEVQDFRLFNHHVSAAYSPWVNNPVLYVHKNESNALELKLDYFYIEGKFGKETSMIVADFVNQTNLDIRFRQKNIDDHVQKTSMNLFVKELFMVIAYLVVFLVMSYQFTQMYLETYQKEIAIKTSLGYGFFKKHRMIFIVTAFVYLAPMCLIGFKNGFNIELVTYLTVIILIEEGILSVVLRFFDRKSLIQVLKGGN